MHWAFRVFILPGHDVHNKVLQRHEARGKTQDPQRSEKQLPGSSCTSVQNPKVLGGEQHPGKLRFALTSEAIFTQFFTHLLRRAF